MIIDSHCHLNMLDLSPYEGQLAPAIEAAFAADISHMLCVSVDLPTFPEVLSIAQQYPNIYASVGLHPNDSANIEPSVDDLIKLATQDKIVAIGETGLDYFRSQDEDMTWQQQRFRRHIAAAKATKNPLIIHMRDAASDTITIMREEQAAQAGGVMHCFTETWDVAKQVLDLGFYISISGIVTFKNAKALQAVAQQVPLDRLLIETDAPYLAPVPMRGKPNEPKYLKHTAAFIADLRGMSYDSLAKATSDNFFRLFAKAENKPA